MVFNGADVAEKFDVSANGSRLRFTRDVGSITMDLDGVEKIDFNALGGADTVTVNDLTGTDVTTVNLDLGGSRRRHRRRPGRLRHRQRHRTAPTTIQRHRRRHRRHTVTGLPAVGEHHGSEGANDTLASTPSAATTRRRRDASRAVIR